MIRTETLHEMFDVAGLLAHQPLPGGARVGIVTNAGGPAVLCADACSERQLAVPEPSPALRDRLLAAMPAGASLGNPVDMLAEARGDHYREALRLMAEAGEFDALVAIFVPPLVTSAEEVARGIREASEQLGGLPLATVFMSARGVPEELRSGERRVPSFEFPEDAAVALAHAARLSAWRTQAGGEPRPVPDADAEAARAIIDRALEGGPGWLSPAATGDLLRAYGIPLAPTAYADTPIDAARAARRLRGQVALKAIAPGLVHRTEAGAVRLGLRGAAAVMRAASEMKERIPELDAFQVQAMVSGVEMLIGLVQDPSFGPVLACGAGGTAVELMRDVSVALTPVTEPEVDEMIRSLRMYPLLSGFRGAEPADVGALAGILHRVSALAESHLEIVELDLNPVVVETSGATVVDPRVRVAAAPEVPLLGAR